MKAIILKEPGTTDNLIYGDIAMPGIRSEEVLIQVKFISINPVDIQTRKGEGAYIYANLEPGQELILGWDISGIVVQSRSDLLQPGDEVFGMVNFPGVGAAYAAFVAAPASHLTKKPENISYAEAAGATLAALTAWQNLVNRAKIKKGDRVLIHAAAGGVGHYAVQIAKHIGAYVIGTSSAANKDFIMALGADEHIDYHRQNLAERITDVDFVLESTGKQNILDSLDLIKPGGQLISILAQITEEAKEKAAKNSIAIDWTAVYSSGADMEQLANLLRSGAIRSHISNEFAFGEMAAAHRAIESGRTIGKIVVGL